MAAWAKSPCARATPTPPSVISNLPWLTPLPAPTRPATSASALKVSNRRPDSSPRMRITHVITRLVIGGAQENTVASVLGLRRKPGLEVDLISGPTRGPEGSLEPALRDAPGILTLVPELVRPVHPWNDWLARRRLTEIFRRTRPDLVHTHSGK